MKARNLLKILFTMTAVFAFTATFAQENAPWSDMTGSSEESKIDTVVVNDTVPYYVEPDPIINDNYSGPYDPTQSNADQNIEDEFTWSYKLDDGSTGSSDDIVFITPDGQGTLSAPYRKVSFESEGNFYVNVVEERPDMSCGTDGGTDQEVLVIQEPTYSDPAFSGGDMNIEVCDGATGEAISIDDITAQLDGYSDYYFRLDITKRTVESDGTEIDEVYSNTDTIVKIGTNAGAEGESGPVDLLTGLDFYTGDDGTDDRITEYKYTIKGFNHHISRKGNFLDLQDDGDGTKPTFDDYTNYSSTEVGYYEWDDATERTLTVTVFPQPNTGNIRYVPNNFEL